MGSRAQLTGVCQRRAGGGGLRVPAQQAASSGNALERSGQKTCNPESKAMCIHRPCMCHRCYQYLISK
jgi:hypothetical protein